MCRRNGQDWLPYWGDDWLWRLWNGTVALLSSCALRSVLIWGGRDGLLLIQVSAFEAVLLSTKWDRRAPQKRQYLEDESGLVAKQKCSYRIWENLTSKTEEFSEHSQAHRKMGRVVVSLQCGRTWAFMILLRKCQQKLLKKKEFHKIDRELNLFTYSLQQVYFSCRKLQSFFWLNIKRHKKTYLSTRTSEFTYSSTCHIINGIYAFLFWGEWSCVETGIEFDEPYGSHPTWVILWIYVSMILSFLSFHLEFSQI